MSTAADFDSTPTLTLHRTGPSSSRRRQTLPPPELESRYAKDGILGRGGMGTVFLMQDHLIGRQIAMKVMRPERHRRPDLRERFMREALVQGRLEHPSIVPVYDLGTSDAGEAYFTMKRVNGLSLADVIEGLAAGDRAIEAEFPLRRTLGALSQACLAIAYAHSNGVVHRDLKPENIMLGDFGEVYVLDWGVAKVCSVAEADALAKWDKGAQDPIESGVTEAGSLLGTPGYMAPEQARGDIDVDGRADIYALGVTLFELLTLSPLHARRGTEHVLQSTLLGGFQTPSERAPERAIPSELEAICIRALELDPDRRFPTARSLHTALETFLASANDSERRRELSRRHTLAAQVSLARATLDDEGQEGFRAQALQELGKAIALNPQNENAREAMMKALLAAPGRLPQAEEAQLRGAGSQDYARGAKIRAWVYGVWLACLQSGWFLGIRELPLWLLLNGVLLALIGYNIWLARQGSGARRHSLVMMLMAFSAVGLMSGVFGPLVLVPTAALATAAAFTVSLRADARQRRWIMTLSLASIVVPTLVQLLSGNLYSVGLAELAPWLVTLDGPLAVVVLMVGTLLTLVFANLLVGTAVEAFVRAERRGYTQRWRLRQMLPVRAEGSEG